MREGVYLSGPDIGSRFSFVCDSGDVLEIGRVVRAIDGPRDLRVWDEWGNDWLVEKD